LVSNKHIPLVCMLKLNLDFAFDTSWKLVCARGLMVLEAPLLCLLHQTKKSHSMRNIWSKSNGKRTR
jgi:hypothetical protein